MFPLLAYLLGCGEGSKPFCPSYDEFGVADQTCIDMKKSNPVVAQTSTPAQSPAAPKADTYEQKSAPVFCPSVDEFGVRDPNCSRFR